MNRFFTKKLFTISAILMLTLTSFAQTGNKGVISSGGRTVQSKDIEISYTIGEPIITLIGSSKVELNQGFQQAYPSAIVTSLNNEVTNISQNLKIFPNPVSEVLNFEFTSPFTLNTFIKIYSTEGKLIQEELLKFNQLNYSIPTEKLTAGMYYIQVIDASNQQLFHSKFIKK